MKRALVLGVLCAAGWGFLSAVGHSLPRDAAGPAAGTVYLAPFTLTRPGAASVAGEEGLMFVPEHRGKPASHTIGFHFIRLRGSSGQKRSPVFYLPGGPGNFTRREQMASDRFRPQLDALLGTGRDILFVNQRGNPQLPMAADLRWPAMPQPLDAPASPERNRTAIRQSVAEGLATWTRRGVDLSGYDIINIADDVDDLRAALGYDKIILRGGSFGSQWSFSVVKRHPTRVDRAILHGIEPLDYGYDSPAWLWNAVGRAAALAKADARVSPLLPADGLLGALKTVLDRLEANPVTVAITNPKTGEEVKITIGRHDLVRLMKYPTVNESLRDNLRKWPRFILEMYRGDYRYLAALALLDRTAPDGGPMIALLIDNSLGISEAREKRLLAEPEARWIGSLEPEYFASRDLTPTRRVDDAFRTDWDITVPMLLLQGDVDFSTPLENAQHAGGFLKNGRVLVVEGGTHDVTNETVAMLPEVGAAIQRFMARDIGAGARADLFEGLPERARLPAPDFETLDGPALYDRWLARNRVVPAVTGAR